MSAEQRVELLKDRLHRSGACKLGLDYCCMQAQSGLGTQHGRLKPALPSFLLCMVLVAAFTCSGKHGSDAQFLSALTQA